MSSDFDAGRILQLLVRGSLIAIVAVAVWIASGLFMFFWVFGLVADRFLGVGLPENLAKAMGFFVVSMFFAFNWHLLRMFLFNRRKFYKGLAFVGAGYFLLLFVLELPYRSLGVISEDGKPLATYVVRPDGRIKRLPLSWHYDTETGLLTKPFTVEMARRYYEQNQRPGSQQPIPQAQLNSSANTQTTFVPLQPPRYRQPSRPTAVAREEPVLPEPPKLEIKTYMVEAGPFRSIATNPTNSYGVNSKYYSEGTLNLWVRKIDVSKASTVVTVSIRAIDETAGAYLVSAKGTRTPGCAPAYLTDADGTLYGLVRESLQYVVNGVGSISRKIQPTETLPVKLEFQPLKGESKKFTLFHTQFGAMSFEIQ